MGDSSFTASRPHVVVSGYYGFDNLGDELILQTLVDHCKAKDYHLTVLSANPERTQEQYGVDAIGRMDFEAIVKALWRAHLFISGGGGLFQDTTGWKSPVYYGGLILLARFMAVPTVVWGQGIGPLMRPVSRWFAGIALRQAQTILVRDEHSAALLKELLPADHPITVTTDPVWTLSLAQHPPTTGASYHLGISLREWPTLTPEGIQHLAQTLRTTFAATPDDAAHLTLHLLVFQKEQDVSPLAQLCEAFNDTPPTVSVEWVYPHQVCEKLPQLDGIIAMRFHAVLLALLSGVPAFSIPYAPKVEHLTQQFNLQGTAPETLHQLDSAVLREGLPQQLPEESRHAVKILKAQAQENFSALEAALQEGLLTYGPQPSA